ncbi:MAG: TMEM175 family protein [Anaerolineales bacterium]|jgi:uncharacterized membrane protein
MASKTPHSHPAETYPDSQDDLGLERIVFFTDAVMAIAITLLVIDLKLPDLPEAVAAAELPAYLSALTPRIISFVISFAVVGIYWSSHHRYFRYIKRYDGQLIFLNLLFLLFIVLMPFVASLIGQYGYLPAATITYALAVAAIGFAIGGLWWYASHQHRLVDPGLDDGFIRTRSRIALVVPLIFALSVPFAWINPRYGQAIWLIAPFVSLLVQRFSESRPARKVHPHVDADEKDAGR